MTSFIYSKEHSLFGGLLRLSYWKYEKGSKKQNKKQQQQQQQQQQRRRRRRQQQQQNIKFTPNRTTENKQFEDNE